jgi:hypothetical protein
MPINRLPPPLIEVPRKQDRASPTDAHAAGPLAAVAFALARAGASVIEARASGEYTDGPTSQWFQSLVVPGTTRGCCDQADCHPMRARYDAGYWMAESKVYPGEWVAIPAARVLATPSIFGEEGVLCESDRKNGDDEPIVSQPSSRDVWVYCFAPPPQST